MKTGFLFFAKEGRVHLLITLSVAIFMTWFAGWWSIFAWMAVVFVIQFFRDPPRISPEGSGLVVSPADGKVIFAGSSIDPFLGNRKAQKISVFMNVFNVHSNRIPDFGKIESLEYRPGKFFNAALDKASQHNECQIAVIRADYGEITCVQVAGLVARRILCYLSLDQEVKRGERYGFIRFGSRLDIYLPSTLELQVSVGDKVSSGVDVIAKVQHINDD